MSNSISSYTFNNNQIRTSIYEGNPVFCLKDICQVLDIKKMRQVRARLNERGVYQIGTPSAGGKQKTSFINEPNLYRCILKSDKPEAKKFEDWIVEEVLPQIRKTGEYKPDFETALTTVKQHTRKLPTVRVKKELTLPKDVYKNIGGVVKVVVKSEMDKYMKILIQPKLDFNQMDLPEAQKANLTIFKDLNKMIAEYGRACEIIGNMQGIVALKKMLPENLYKQVSESVSKYSMMA